MKKHFILIIGFLLGALQFIPPDMVLSKPEAASKKSSQTLSRKIQAGKQLFEKNRCYDCHSVEGKGGCLAPPFDGISKRRSREFVLSRITDDDSQIEKFEKLYGDQELMPHVRLPLDKTEKITSYLLSLPERKKDYQIIGHELKNRKEKEMVQKLIRKLDKKAAHTPEEKAIAEGKRLVAEKGCQACHRIGKIGGSFGPTLNRIGSRKSVDYIVEHILAAELQPNKLKPGVDRMPSSGLTMNEIESITHYLRTLK